MRIGINASYLRKPSTGIGQVTVHFLRELIKQDSVEKTEEAKNEIILFTEDREGIDLLGELPRNVTIKESLPNYKRDDLIRKLWWEKYTLPREVSSQSCDIFLSLYQCPTKIEQKETQHFMLVHDLIPEKFAKEYLNNSRKKIYWQQTKAGIIAAPKIIAVSQNTAQDIKDVTGRESNVAHISVDPIFDEIADKREVQRVKDKFAITGDYIYTGGGLELRKNVQSTILAYKKLIDAKLNQTGTGQPEKIPTLVISGTLMPQLAPLWTDVEKITTDLQIREHVKILGHVPQGDLPGLYAGAQCFIFPSLYEGFGMPVLEAMKQKTAVITVRTSSIPEICRESVLYCEPKDVHDIESKITSLVVDESLREAYAQKGYDQSKKFAWSKTVRSMRQIFEV